MRKRVSKSNSPVGGAVGGLLLAAGESRRAGRHNKLLHPFAGKALLRHAAEALAGSNTDRNVMVTGYQYEAVAAVVRDLPFTIRYNANHARGLGTSLAQGITALGDCNAILVCLGDMPHITAKLIDRLIETYRCSAVAPRSHGRIIVPVYAGQFGHPKLFTREFFATLALLDEDVGARAFVRRYIDCDCVELLPVDSAAILRDYDTVDALNRQNRNRHRG